MSEEEKVLEFIREFAKQRGTTPSVRRICREANLTPPRFYRMFGSLESAIEQAGLSVDATTKDRLKISRKATRKRIKKSKRKHAKKEEAPSIVESGDIEQPYVRTFEKIQKNITDKEEAQDSIKENARNFAEELKTLALSGHPDINGPILEALGEVVSSVLFYKYDIAADIPDLLSANDILREVKKERKKLRKQQIHLDGERLEIQGSRELLKRDSDKRALIEHIEKLEWKIKVDTKRFNETYEAFKRFRILFRELMPVVRKFPPCQQVFVQNMMENHNDVLKWLTSGGMRLSFETGATSSS